MQKRKKLAVIGTLLIVLVAGGIVWQVVDVNRTGRSPVSALFKNEGLDEKFLVLLWFQPSYRDYFLLLI